MDSQSKSSFMKRHGFTITFFSIFIFLALFPIPEKFNKPLTSCLVILLSSWCIDIGIIHKNHVPGIKTVLLKVFFPIMVFSMLTGNVKNKADFVRLLKYPALALGHGIWAFVTNSIAIWYFHKCGVIPNWPSALATMFGMGSLAPGTTSYPFAKDATRMGMLDLGNKIFSLFIIAIVIGKSLGGTISTKKIILKVMKMPIVLSFTASIIFILFEIKVVKHMKISGQFCKQIQEITNPIMLFFIGLKFQLPGPEQLELFVPIFLRRTFSMLFLVLLQLIAKVDQKEFTDLMVFVNASNSIWPYVHMQATMDDPKDKSECDSEYSFQIVIYDYATAVFLNMIFSSFDIGLEIATCIMGIYAIITLIFAYFTLQSNVLKQVDESKKFTNSVISY